MTDVPHQHLGEKLHRIESIDALRGLAALLVLFYHGREMFWIGAGQTFRQYKWHPDFSALVGYLSLPFSYGSVGVTLFFVLSGYCIHRRGALALARNPEAKFDLGVFAARWFWRIYPTYTVALLLTALIDWWLFSKGVTAEPGQDDSPWAFGVSLFALQGYLAHFFGSNGVFWTLAMEVHLYAAYPLLYYFSRKFGAERTLSLTLGVALAYLAANAVFGFEEWLPYRFQRGPVFLPYWFTWTMGFYLAECEAGRSRDAGAWTWRILMVLGFAAGLALTLLKAYVVADLFWALFFGGFLRWSLRPQGRLFWNRSFGIGLSFVGVFSYSLYAIHVPLLHALHYLMAPAAGYKFATIWPAFFAIAGVIPCAWLFFHLVEWWSVRKPGERIAVPFVMGRQHG